MADDTKHEEPKTELVLAEPEVLPLEKSSGDIVVIARNPEEMVHAQQNLIDWADSKVAFERQELAEAEQNLATAKSLKHRTAGWSRQVNLARGRVVYYEKIHSALKEGFCIVPNFPIQVIATRTNKKPRIVRKRMWNPPDITQEQLPQGKGTYVDPTPEFYRGTQTRTLSDGRTTQENFSETTGTHRPVDFPFKMVKPQVLQDLKRATMLKLFDDIGVLPQARTRQPDPMLIGRIRRREGSRDTTISFLITWWIDSRDL